MADNVDGRKLFAAQQGFGHLADGVACGVENDDLGTLAPDSGDAVCKFRGDEDDFAA